MSDIQSALEETMTIRTVVWGENVHEQTSKVVQAIYPDGMHETIASALRQDKQLRSLRPRRCSSPSMG